MLDIVHDVYILVAIIRLRFRGSHDLPVFVDIIKYIIDLVDDRSG